MIPEPVVEPRSVKKSPCILSGSNPSYCQGIFNKCDHCCDERAGVIIRTCRPIRLIVLSCSSMERCSLGIGLTLSFERKVSLTGRSDMIQSERDPAPSLRSTEESFFVLSESNLPPVTERRNRESSTDQRFDDECHVVELHDDYGLVWLSDRKSLFGSWESSSCQPVKSNYFMLERYPASRKSQRCGLDDSFSGGHQDGSYPCCKKNGLVPASIVAPRHTPTLLVVSSRKYRLAFVIGEGIAVRAGGIRTHDFLPPS